ncbi:NAD-dependent epimerase/dehydratase family protein [Kitasatospora viridis]|uniref:ADP-glyceromanno-heptose 6-epimerase n=1 Tax=Kitasatospora viridis TaxID=281105 RepID=A0A561TSR5_9ACTN|nr:NAD-dependent epimerase/dehydratase family protein [Kitasatospora viridis]TWF90165.1 ADP-glyceromanno-heptose 6-epimerase precursor [Kitasatospora viridis]
MTGSTRPRPEVLVTGAAGFVGGHTVRACREAGWAVTALDVREVPAATAPASDCVLGRADHAPVLADLRAGRYAAVVHQGAISSTLESDRAKLQDANVRQPLALAEACADSGALFVYASSHSVYGTIHRRIAVAEDSEEDASVCTGPLNRYAESKLALDREMAGRYGSGAAWVGLRYTNVFGTGEEHKGQMASIISQLLRGAAQGRRLTLFADTLKACRDYVPVESVARTVVALLRHQVPSGVYNLGSGCPVSFATLLEWCAEFSGAELDVRLVPNPVADRYQYWTCADQSRLQGVLPGGRPELIEDVRSGAATLFRHFQEQWQQRANGC